MMRRFLKMPDVAELQASGSFKVFNAADYDLVSVLEMQTTFEETNLWLTVQPGVPHITWFSTETSFYLLLS